MLASASTVPTWTLPATVVGIILAVVTIWALTSSNRAVIDSGLAGDDPKPPQHRRFFRGESARSIAQMAADSSASIGRELDEWKDKFDRLELAQSHERELWKSEKASLNLRIDSLVQENKQLRELVTDRGWAEKLIKKLDDNHRELLDAVRAR